MKKAGLIILVIGILITVFTGLKFITKEKVIDVGALQITRDKNHSLTWSPLIGVATMVVGGVIYLLTNKKR